MADKKRVSFGRVTGWAVDDEIYEKHGIVNRMTLAVNEDQIDELIDYLSNKGNMGKYGVEFDITLFEADADKAFISSGSLSPKFKKEDSSSSSSKSSSGRSGGRRSL